MKSYQDIIQKSKTQKPVWLVSHHEFNELTDIAGCLKFSQ